jgi:hypothetical protein
MLDRRDRSGRITLGADKPYDVTDFLEALRQRDVTPHITINGTISKHRVVRQDGERRPHETASRLRDHSGVPQADRRGVGLDPGRRQAAAK